MIIGKNILSTLEHSKFDFYLTGSRYFGTAKHSSDWDFFTQDCSDIRPYLEELGGIKEYKPKYKDSVDVYYLFSPGIRIHIQIVDSVYNKLKMQEYLEPFYNLVPKELHVEMWKIAALQVERMEDD